MRARNIKPGLFSDEDLVECSFPARILFMGLPCLADRMGRLEDRPKKIKMLLMPADNVDCEALLDELAKAGKIKRYEAQGKRCIWIPGFLNHQEPHRNEKPSALPRHPEDRNPEEGPKAKANVPDQGQNNVGPRAEPLALIPDSGFLNPESERQTITPPTDDITARAGERTQPEESGGGVGEEFAGAPLEAQPWAVSLEIQQIGEGYPVHRYDPGAAEVAMKELSKRRQWPGLPRILADLTARCQCDDWTRENGRFVPQLSRYIRDRMWLNPIPEARAAPQPGYASPESKAIDDIATELRRKEQKHEHELPESHPGECFACPQAAGVALPPLEAGRRAGPPGR